MATTIRKRGIVLKYSNSDKGKVWVDHGNLYFASLIQNEHRSFILDRFCFSSAFTFSHHPYIFLWNKTFKDSSKRWQIEKEQQTLFFFLKTFQCWSIFHEAYFPPSHELKFPFNFFSCVPFMVWGFIPSVERCVISSHYHSVLVS